MACMQRSFPCTLRSVQLSYFTIERENPTKNGVVCVGSFINGKYLLELLETLKAFSFQFE